MKRLLAIPVALLAVAAGAVTGALQDRCGPFTDVSPAFCPYVLEMYYLGITAGTSPTTYSPDNPVTRGQAAVFVSKGINQAIARSSRRASLGQWWTTTPMWADGFGATTLPVTYVNQIVSDGADVWAAGADGTVWRVRGSDGKVLDHWTTASFTYSVIVAMGRVFAAGSDNLYMIDPSQPAGEAAVVATGVGSAVDLDFDGQRIWATNDGGTLAIVTPSTQTPWPVTVVDFPNMAPFGLVFDGVHVWMTDNHANGKIHKLGSDGSVLQSVDVAEAPAFPVFDGTNIWVPGQGGFEVTVIRSASGAVVGTVSGNNLHFPFATAFDGVRVLVSNQDSSLSLFRAVDLSPIGYVYTLPALPRSLCSDGINFWVSLLPGQIGRF